MVKVASKERRNFSRAKRVLSIEYRLASNKHKGNGNSWQLSMTQDMSAGGLSFYSDQEFRKDDIVELHVAMSGILDIFKGFARVVRVERKRSAAFYFVAVQFLDGNPFGRQAKSYIDNRKAGKKPRRRI